MDEVIDEQPVAGAGGTPERLSIQIDSAGILNYASVVNKVPIVQTIELTNHTSDNLLDLTVEIRSNPELIEPKTLHIVQISEGQDYVLGNIQLTADKERLSQLNEPVPVTLTVEVRGRDGRLATSSIELVAAAYEQWPGERLMPQLLAAFSQPNTKAVSGVLKGAAAVLRNSSNPIQMSGYQVADRRKVLMQISAIYSAIARMQVDYANPPAALAQDGQRIRTPVRILQDGLATCLDTTLLFASAMEACGLNPVLLLTKGHAWVACWLTETSSPKVWSDDAQEIRKRIAEGEMIAVETTLVCVGGRDKFSVAMARGAERLDPEKYHDFCFAIDVARARHQKISPLPAPGESVIDEEQVDSGDDVVELDVPAIPDIPDDADKEVIANAGTTAERIEQWKTQLLDHSMRNRLLNCDPGKHSLRFTHPNPGLIEDMLADGRQLQIESIEKHAIRNDPRSEELLSRKADKSYQHELAEQALHRSRLVTLVDEKKTKSDAVGLFRNAKSNEEETGSNTLYFCIGSLTWRPENKSKAYQAPLLMLPVQIKRRSVGSSFKLVLHDDPPILNPTLLQVLLEQFAISIPEIPAPHALPTDQSGVDVDRILGLIKRAVAEQPNMEVRADIIQLGNYSFAKYLLWKDLENRADELLKHPLVKLMVEDDEEAGASLHMGPFLEPNDLDETVDVGDLNLVTMADASQMVVIHEAARGRSFVVEGPPGTGKSETITNLIADQLARGKRVLFVSEKMEALEVVHKRLCKVGLDPFLLVLHAAKASKKEVVEQYRQAVDAASAHQPEGWEAIQVELRQKRDALNAHVQLMHQPHACGLSVFKAITILARHPDWKVAPLSWPSLESVGKSEFVQLAGVARNLGVLAESFGGFASNPITGIRATSFTPSWRDELVQASQQYTKCYARMHQLCSKVAGIFNFNQLTWTSSDYDNIETLCRALLDPPAPLAGMAAAQSLESATRVMGKLSGAIKQRQSLGTELFQDWIEDSLELNVPDIKTRWRAALGKFFILSWFATFSIRNQLAPYIQNGKRPASNNVLDSLQRIEGVKAADAEIEQVKNEAQALLGVAFQGLQTNIAQLSQALQWNQRLSRVLNTMYGRADLAWGHQRVMLKTVDKHRSRFMITGDIGQLFEQTMAAKAAHDLAFRKICELAGRKTDEVASGRPNELDAWAREVSQWPGASKLMQPWCVWLQQRATAVQQGLELLVTALEAGTLMPDEFEEFFQFSFADWWLNQMVDRTPTLQRFSRPLHERAIQDFRELDEQFIQATRLEVFAKLAARVPRPDVNIPGSPMGFLKDQITRQRGHRPVREIMERLGPQNLSLKPCMMMSPLTVAQYLDVADTQFDIAVFDEASQIKTCDAVGVLARAPQLVVVGDSKQLPPTSFFATSTNDDDGHMEDHESILDECAAVLPSHRLRWHYRSRHESLIAFSNDRYYDGELITMPGPANDKAVTLHKVEGVYDHGKSRTNRIEAAAVIQFVRKRVLSPITRLQSIGVVTFSKAQQELILNLLDRERSEDIQLDNALKGAYNNDNDEIFVKNLESVQGDQRDVIVFSICYGPSHNGIVYNQFGPLNKEGGQRRLNVAVTRAADEVHVFASMNAEDIKSSYLQASASGVGDFKRYLGFARDGVGALETYSSPTGRDVDSEFEAQVLKRLVAIGWDVHLQVGISKFRIDLAVVDPRKPGRYLAGVECDGATYHSSATARDRDIVREGVLRNLGWTILRIWSTDWWNNAEAEVERIHGRLLQLTEIPLPDELQDDEGFSPGDVPPEDLDDVYDETLTAEPANDNERGAEQQLRANPSSTPVHEQYPEFKLLTPAPINCDLYDIQAARPASQVAEQVLEQCAPMLEVHLCRIVLEAFGQKRLTAKAAKVLRKYLSVLPKTIESGETVFWSSREQAESYDRFRIGDGRELDEVPLIELSNLAAELLSHAIQCSDQDLGRVINEKMGRTRFTADAKKRTQSAIDRMLSTGAGERVNQNSVRYIALSVS